MREHDGGSTNQSDRAKYSRLGLALALGLFMVVEFGVVLLGWRSFFSRDFLSFGYPLAWHLRESLLQGELPLWNDHLMAGVPHLAQWNTMALYAPMGLLVLLPMPWALNVFNLGHLVLGAFGMCRWVELDSRTGSRSWVGGVVAGLSYGLGGLMLTSMMWPNNAAALGWAPWVVYWSCRAVCEGGRSMVWAVGCLVLQLLCGAPEVLALTWAIAGVAAVARARSHAVSKTVLGIRMVVCGALVLAVGAAQWVPFLDLLRQSHRDASYAGNTWSMSWEGLAGLLLPWFQTAIDRDGVRYQASQQWLISPYCGMMVTMFAGLAFWRVRQRWIWLVVAAASVFALMSLGSDGWILDGIRRVFPWLGNMRYPAKFVVPLLLIIPWLGGVAMCSWLGCEDQQRRWREAIGMLLVLSAMMLVLGGLELARVQDGVWRGTMAHVATRLLLVVLTGWTLLRWVGSGASSRSWLFPVVLVVLAGWDLIEANRHICPTVPSSLMRSARFSKSGESVANAPVMEPMPMRGAGRAHVSRVGQRRLDEQLFETAEAAVQIPRLALVLNMNLLENIPKLDGFLSLYLPRTLKVLSQLEQASEPVKQRWFSMLGVTYVARDRTPWVWDRTRGDGSWVRWVSRARVEDDEEALKLMGSETFDPFQSLILGENPDVTNTGLVAEGEVRAAVKVLRSTSHGWRIETEAGREGYLFMAQAYEEGWKAKVDGLEARVLRADVAFQAVRLSAGRHVVELDYEPASFRAGIGVSVAGLLGWLALFIRSRSSRV